MRHERYRPKDFDIRRVMTALFGEPTDWYGQSWWKCPYREEDTPSFTVYGGEQRFYSWPPAGGPGPGTAVRRSRTAAADVPRGPGVPSQPRMYLADLG